MQQYFAHEGIDHQSTTEAAAHNASDVIPTVLIITAVVVVFLGLIILAVKRLGVQPTGKEDKEK